MSSHKHLNTLVAAGFLCAVLASMTGVSHATVTFTDIGTGWTGTYYDAVAWGDYDADGDLDLLLSGCAGGISDAFTRIYRNDGAGGFAAITAGLPQLMFGSVAWGDYDNDRDLDIALMGEDASQYPVSRVYRNDGGGVFTDIVAGLTDLYGGSVAWGDYDNDGDLDLLLTGGAPGSVVLSKVYRNDGGGVFTAVATALPNIGSSSVAWGDYDNDGDLDILLAGSGPGSLLISRVYRNDGAGVFTDIGAGLTGVSSCSVAWGDYDNDGDLDILLTGSGSGYVPVSRVYRNDGAGVFTDIGAGLPDVKIGSAAWGDYDNDGDLDILLAGLEADGVCISRVYGNQGGGIFTNVGAGLLEMGEGSTAWGDYDHDGDLDIVLTGRESFTRHANVYRSDGAPANTPPTAPSNLSTAALGDWVMLSWNASTDGQTPVAGLSYNLRIGTTPGGSEIMSPMAGVTGAAGGYRRVVQLGNAQMRTSWAVRVPSGTYYWSVQALDGAYAGSPFAAEQVASVSDVDELASPTRFMLRADTPSPVGSAAAVHFDLPEVEWVTLRVFDVAGRCVRVLVDSEVPAGQHQALWDGTDDRGSRVSSGAYFCRMDAGSFSATKRLVLVE